MEVPVVQETAVFDISIVKEEYEVQEWDDDNMNGDVLGDFSALPAFNQTIKLKDEMEYITDLSLEEMVGRSLKTMTPDKFFNCCVCFKRFKYNGPKDVRKHMVIHMRNRPSFPCQFCDKTFLWEESQMRHQTRCTGRPMNQEMSNGLPPIETEHPVFGNLFGSLNFEPSTSQLTRNPPPVLNPFSIKPSTIQSRRDHHTMISRNSREDSRTTTTMRVRNAQENPQNKPAHLCRFCGNKYRFIGTWRQHEKICQQISTEPKFSCKSCGNRYHEKVSLLGHKQICRRLNKNTPESHNNHHQSLHEELGGSTGENHTDVSSFPCGICGNTYKTKQIMRRHQRICQFTEGIPKYSCGNCGNRFHRKISMVHHKNVCRYQMAAFSKNLRNSTSADFTQSDLESEEPSEGSSQFPECNIESRDTSLLCTTCGKTFSNWTILLHHQKDECPRVDGMPQYSCGYCRKGFNDDSSMEQHYRLCATENGNSTENVANEVPFFDAARECYVCSQCGKIFKKKEQVAKHMIVHQKDRPHYTCEICGNKYLWKCDKDHHMKQCSQMESLPTLSCQNCGNKFHREASLQSHVKFCRKTQQQNVPNAADDCTDLPSQSSESLELFNCPICSKIFSKKQYLRIHMMSHTKPGSTFACDLCGNLYRNLRTLSQHRRACQQAEGVPQFVCLICGNRFHEERFMELHRKTCRILTLRHSGSETDTTKPAEGSHSSLTEYPVLDQEEVSSLALGSNLLEEDLSAHDVAEGDQTIPVGEENLTIDECIEKSLQTRTPDKFINCCICLKRYKYVNKMDLKYHMYTHLKNRPMFSCQFCDKTFLWKNTKYTHEAKCTKNHSAFSCQNCGSKFKEESSLKYHQTMCIAPKSLNGQFSGRAENCDTDCYRCETCGMEFKSRHRMVRHATIHMGRSTFSCIFCGNRYLRKKDMMAHERKCQESTSLPTLPCQICGNKYHTEAILRFHMSVCNGLPMAPFESIATTAGRDEQSEVITLDEVSENESNAEHFDAPKNKEKRSGKRPHASELKHESQRPQRHEQNSLDYSSNDLRTSSTEFPSQDSVDGDKVIRIGDMDLSIRECVQMTLDTMTPDKVFTCCYCHKQYKYNGPSELTKHMSIHVRNRPSYPCRVCGRTFFWAKSHRRHEEQCTQTVYTGFFGCSICNKKYQTEKDIERHMMEHVKGKRSKLQTSVGQEEEFSCEICGMQCQTEGSLMAHVRICQMQSMALSKTNCDDSGPSENPLYPDVQVISPENSNDCEIIDTTNRHCNSNNTDTSMESFDVSKGKQVRHASDKYQDQQKTVESENVSKIETIRMGDEELTIEDYIEICMENINSGNVFNCFICQKSYNFKYRIEILRHLRSDKEKKLLSCRFCDLKFITEFHREIHEKKCAVEKNSSKTLSLFCEKCAKEFNEEAQLKIHQEMCTVARSEVIVIIPALENEMNGKEVRQEDDDETETSSENENEPEDIDELPACDDLMIKVREKDLSVSQCIVKSLLAVTPDKFFNCYICAKKLKSSYNVRRHMFSHHVKLSFSCRNCKATFLRKKNWQTHVEKCKLKRKTAQNVQKEEHTPCAKAENSSVISCKVCGKEFPKISTLQYHMNFCHSKSENVSQSEKATHFDRRKDLPSYLCEICGQNFRRNSSRISHMSSCGLDKEASNDDNSPPRKRTKSNQATEESTSLQFQCSMCKKIFCSVQFFNIHKAIHKRPELMHFCNQCGNTYRQKTSLREHQRKCKPGSDAPQFQCIFCGNIYHTKFVLLRHQATCRAFTLQFAEKFKLDSNKFSDVFAAKTELNTENGDRIDFSDSSDSLKYFESDDMGEGGTMTLNEGTIEEYMERTLLTKTHDNIIKCCICTKKHKYTSKKNIRRHLRIHMINKTPAK